MKTYNFVLSILLGTASFSVYASDTMLAKTSSGGLTVQNAGGYNRQDEKREAWSHFQHNVNSESIMKEILGEYIDGIRNGQVRDVQNFFSVQNLKTLYGRMASRIFEETFNQAEINNVLKPAQLIEIGLKHYFSAVAFFLDDMLGLHATLSQQNQQKINIIAEKLGEHFSVGLTGGLDQSLFVSVLVENKASSGAQKRIFSDMNAEAFYTALKNFQKQWEKSPHAYINLAYESLEESFGQGVTLRGTFADRAWGSSLFLADQVLNYQRNLNASSNEWHSTPWRVMNDLSDYMIRTIVGTYNPISTQATDPSTQLSDGAALVTHALRSIAKTSLMYREKVKSGQNDPSKHEMIAFHSITRFFNDQTLSDNDSLNRHKLGAYLIFMKSLYGDMDHQTIINNVKKFFGSQTKTAVGKEINKINDKLNAIRKSQNLHHHIPENERILKTHQNTQRIQNMQEVTKFILDNLTDEKLSYYGKFLRRLGEQENESRDAYQAERTKARQDRSATPRIEQNPENIASEPSVFEVDATQNIPAPPPPPPAAIAVPPPPPPPPGMMMKNITRTILKQARTAAEASLHADMLRQGNLKHVDPNDKQGALPSNPEREEMLNQIKANKDADRSNIGDLEKNRVSMANHGGEGLLGEIHQGVRLKKVTDDDKKKLREERENAANAGNPFAVIGNSILLRRAAMEEHEQNDDWSDDEGDWDDE